jgi:hypothetical protein
MLQTGRSRVRNPMNEFVSNYLILQAALGPEVQSASKRNESQKKKNNVLGSKVRPVRRADNFTAICESIV